MVTPYIRSMRPETWMLAALPIILMSVAVSNMSIFGTALWTGVLIIIFAVVILGSCNMFNEVFDTEIDKINKPNRPIVSGHIKKNNALIASLILFFLANLATYIISFNLFILSIIFTFFGIAYSLPHLRFKDNSIASMLTLGVGYGFIIPIAPWVLFGVWNNIAVWVIIIMSFIWFFGATNSKDFKDAEGDKKLGVKTLVVLINEKNTIKFMIITMSIIPIILLLSYVYLHIFSVWYLIVLIPYLLTFYFLSWLYRNYSADNAFEWYKTTYFLYPSIFMFLAVAFLISGGI